uniref:Aminopeptidase like 1 n=1 Tax=Hucho hucho TaxID=62062 RepID=A0A4W5LKU0_9TELE
MIENVVLEFKTSALDSEPQNRPVLIVRQLNNLQQATWTQVKGKWQPAQKVREKKAEWVPFWTLTSKQSIVGTELGITPVIIRGEELKQKGFGGTIYGVGKAAVNPPALAVLSHKPDSATQTIAWVGKGVEDDTGGLSIKGKTNMPGMKRDCGGAAAILGAFKATGPVRRHPQRIVEINNTDAEGRLVLSDGVVYASKDRSADIILDMATLTGPQQCSFGKYHCAVMTNSEQWETTCVRAGRSSGDLAHPLVFCPELHFNEFTSAVADMKNSVADRKNATSSCAGLFIGSHLGFDWPGVWVHVDIASPVHAVTRGFDLATCRPRHAILNPFQPLTDLD